MTSLIRWLIESASNTCMEHEQPLSNELFVSAEPVQHNRLIFREL